MKKRSFFRFLKNKWFIAIVVVIVIIAGYSIIRNKNKAPSFETATASIGNVIEQVSVTGQVMPVDQADLAFEKSGVIRNLNVSVGQSVHKGDALASLDNADDAAALASAQADLAELSRGLRPQEYAADQAAVTTAQTSLDNATANTITAVANGYVETQAALVNNSDAFFTNPQSPNPTITIHTDSAVTQQRINQERVNVSTALSSWQADIASVSSTTDTETLVNRVGGYLNTVKMFMGDLSTIVNSLSTGNSGMPQAAINIDVTAMNAALSGLAQAINSVSTAATALQSAQSTYDQATKQFNLQEAGSSAETIAAQAAKVAQAQALVDEDTLTSPLDGTVTAVNPKLGEFIGAGSPAISIESVGTYKVEAYVPEADIAKVNIGDLASSTLDAYGSNVDFPERVTMIDPAETVLEGVPTYKVTLLFVNPDSRIRSGMTSNLEIYTHEVDNVVEIPYRAVTITATSSTVRIVNTDGKTYTIAPITTGLKGSDGTIEITSGLNPGDKVVTYIAP